MIKRRRYGYIPERTEHPVGAIILHRIASKPLRVHLFESSIEIE